MSEKTFRLVVAGTISMHVEVKALTLEEAVEKAKGSSTMTFCHNQFATLPMRRSTAMKASK